MEFNPIHAGARQIVQSYGDGGFRITGMRHAGSILLFPFQILAWPVPAAEAVTVDCLLPVAEAAPKVEILLLGTGRRMLAVPPAVLRHYRDAGLSVDVMDTGAACRTYNVLVVEDRRVAAALIAVE